MNYKVKDDHADVDFSIEVGEVKDAEGKVIDDPQLDITVESSDETIVSVTQDGKTGTISFGDPGVAAVTVEVKDQNGTVLASGGDNFTVTTGDPAFIASISLNIPELTPEPEAPPAG